MKTIWIICLSSILIWQQSSAQESSSVKRLSFKKGEVLDLLLNTAFPNSAQRIERYKETAFPVAFDYSYQPQPNFKTTRLLRGNHLPKFMFFGKWENLEKREGFLTNISRRVPDFHHQRRGLFSYFVLSYYELDEDLSFEIDTDKYNVTTAFWKQAGEASNQFVSEWERAVTDSGGKIRLTLKGGKSPIGYAYRPDLVYIAQWDSQAEFDEFAKHYPLDSYKSLANVHQFAFGK